MWQRLSNFARRGWLESKQSIGVSRANLENIELFRMTEEGSWICSSDQVIGGHSTCDLRHENGAIVFQGNISLELDPNDDEYVRSGFCGMRARIPDNALLHGYQALSLRVLSDGRPYRVNLQVDSWNPNDLYMGFLQAPPNEWITAELPFSNFLCTSEGKLKVNMGSTATLKPEEIRSVGISLADETEGPFRLEIASIGVVAKVSKIPFTFPCKKVNEEPRIPRKDSHFAF